MMEKLGNYAKIQAFSYIKQFYLKLVYMVPKFADDKCIFASHISPITASPIQMHFILIE